MTSTLVRSHLPRPTVPLKLVSMRLPDTMDWIRQKSTDTDLSMGDRNLLQLHPGQPGEIAFELENEGNHSIPWHLEMTGNFPLSWHTDHQQTMDQQAMDSESMDPQGSSADPEQAERVEASTPNAYGIRDVIAGGDRQSRSVYLQVPNDFFEGQDALAEQASLTLDYRAEIYLFAEWNDERRLVGYQSLEIQVRPDSRYMTLLPEIFQSEDFMMRFLSIFEQTFDPSLQMLGSLWAYLDPLTAPRSMLPFLSKWVAWDLNPRWTMKQQRRLMRYAVELYRWRGTRRGLRYYLHLYTDLRLDDDRPESEKQISIIDDTSDAFVFGEAAFGEGMMMGGGQPFHFKVILRPDTMEECDRLEEDMIHQVIERVKPAFCTYTLDILRPGEPATTSHEPSPGTSPEGNPEGEPDEKPEGEPNEEPEWPEEAIAI